MHQENIIDNHFRNLTELLIVSPPRWLPLARHEARTVLTSKGPWILAVLLVIYGYRPAYIPAANLGPNLSVAFIQNFSRLLLPLGVLLLSYRSIVGERNSGSLKFLLGLPLTRGDILLGKIVGRTTGIALPVFAAILAVVGIGAIRFGGFSPLLFIGMTLATMLYILLLVTVATSASTVSTSTVRVTGLLFGGFYLIMSMLWKAISTGLYGSVAGAVSAYNVPADGRLFALLRISPGRNYRLLTNWLLDTGNSGAGYATVLTKLEPGHTINGYVVETAFGSTPAPIYLHESVSLLSLAVWFVAAGAIGYGIFSRSDLA